MGRAVTAPPVAFEVVADEPGFRSLEAAWSDLLERVRNPNHFQSFIWTWRTWEHIARPRGQKLFIVVGRRADEVVLIWPLVRFRKAGLQTAEWIGGEHAYCQDVLVEDTPEAGEWIDAAWAHATKRVDFMWLNHMREDAALVPFVRRVEGVRVDVEKAPYVDWSDWSDWEAYYRSRTKNLRKDLGRRRRRLEEQGKVEFGFVTSSDGIGETLDWMLEQKAAWLKSSGIRMQDGGIDTSETREFYRAVVADARASGHLRLATLTLDGKVLAAELGIRFDRVMVDYFGVYDHAWDKFAPGKLLQADLLRWTLENGCTVFDFMPWGEGYKYLWTPKDADSSTYLVPCSASGRMLIAWRRSRPGAAVRRLLRLRPADIPRILRNRLLGRPARR